MKKIKHLSVMFLTICLLLGAFPIVASAATQQEAVNWARRQEGKSIDYDGAYGAQCVDLIMKYCHTVFGVWIGGNGCDYRDYCPTEGHNANTIPAGWTRTQYTKGDIPQPGDIIVYIPQSKGVPSKNGHVSICISATENSYTCMSQSGGKTKYLTKSHYDNVWGFIHPAYSDKEGEPTVIFSNYQVRVLTATSAEPYATVNSTGAKVTEVGMYIGLHENSLTKLGSDNGKAGYKKNMWYNTVKYGYPLKPGTTYYYQPYAVVDGETYKGEVQSFTTPGPKSCSHSYNSSGYCKNCGQEYPMSVTSMAAATYEVVKDNVPVRDRPYAPDETIALLPAGTKVTVVASGTNSADNLWYKLDDGTWVYSKNIKEVEQSKQPADCNGNHTKGEYQFCEKLHPHERYWKCADCGALFTDGSTQELDSCEICNPKSTSVTFSNYKVRELTATSAEPYATATASSGKVARVGMMIGTSKDALTQLGTDNGTPKPLKNMWYNTTKYGYELKPGTTYYYQPFAEVNGTRYYGDIKSFTTPAK